MKLYKNIVFVLCMILPLLASCGEKEEKKKKATVFEKAEVLPERITEGEKARVAWKVANATTLLLYEERGQVPVLVSSNLALPEGSVMVSPRASTTFRLEAAGPNGKKDAWVSVEVTPRQNTPPSPPPPDPNPDPGPGPDSTPDPNPDPGPGPDSTPDPRPVPPPPPPPQNTCVENPGVSFGIAGKANNMGPIVAPNENTVVFFFTTTEPDGSFVKFNMAKSVDGGVTFSTKPFREFSAIEFIPDNGTVGAIMTSGGGNILNLIWVNSANNSYKLTFNRSYDLGETWTSDVVIPDSPVAGLFGSGLASYGSNLYFFYTNSTDANKLWANISHDNGQSWGVAKVVYESTNSVASESAFVDSQGKLYLVFGEKDFSTNPPTQFTSLITSLDGVNWSMPARVPILNESSPEVGATIANLDSTIYQWHRDGGTWKIRSSSDFSNWTLVGTPPISGTTLVGPYGFIVAQSASCGNNLVGLKVTRSSDGLVWSAPSWFQVLSIPNTDLGPNGGFVYPSFSLAATPSGKLRTLRTRIIKNVDVNDPSELYLMRDP